MIPEDDGPNCCDPAEVIAGTSPGVVLAGASPPPDAAVALAGACPPPDAAEVVAGACPPPPPDTEVEKAAVPFTCTLLDGAEPTPCPLVEAVFSVLCLDPTTPPTTAAMITAANTTTIMTIPFVVA
jgi:hypothetical protein